MRLTTSFQSPALVKTFAVATVPFNVTTVLVGTCGCAIVLVGTCGCATLVI